MAASQPMFLNTSQSNVALTACFSYSPFHVFSPLAWYIRRFCFSDSLLPSLWHDQSISIFNITDFQEAVLSFIIHSFVHFCDIIINIHCILLSFSHYTCMASWYSVIVCCQWMSQHIHAWQAGTLWMSVLCVSRRSISMWMSGFQAQTCQQLS